MGSSFRDTGSFTNLPYFGMKLGHKFRQKLHIYSLPRGSKLSLFSLYGQWFPRYGPIFKIAIFGHETWPLANVPEVAHILISIPGGHQIGSKFSWFSLYKQRFLRHRLVFKNAIFEYETWPLAKVSAVAHTLFLHQGVEIELIFALRAAVAEIWADFQNCHIWAWNLTIGQISQI